MGFDYHTQTGESLTREMLDPAVISIDKDEKNAVFLTDNFHWALDMKQSQYGIINSEFFNERFLRSLLPRDPNIYLLMNIDMFRKSKIFKENKYAFKLVIQSGDNILLRISPDYLL